MGLWDWGQPDRLARKMPLDGVTAPDYTLTLVEPSLIDEAQSVSKGIDARRLNAP